MMSWHMNHLRLTKAAVAALISATLAACAASTDAPRPRVELPQQLRLPPADTSLLSIFERRVGKIAIVDEDGSLRITDQLGRESNVLAPIRERSSKDTESRYVTLAWSPDGTQLAVAQHTRKDKTANAIVELNPASVTIRRSSRSVTLLESEDGETQSLGAEGGSTYTERNPSVVIIQRSQSAESLIASAVYVVPLNQAMPIREVFYSSYEEVQMLDWSPNGQWIAVMTKDFGEDVTRLYLVEPRDGVQPKFIFEGQDVNWQWHPNGDKLLLRQSPSLTQPPRVVLYDARQGTSTTITPRGGDARLAMPSFSPSGEFMLITARARPEAQQQRDTRYQLLLADYNGNPVKPLTEFAGQIYFSWSPKGNQIAYFVESPSSNGGLLQVIDLPDGRPRLISERAVRAFFWSPDGERIAALSSLTPDEMNPNFLGYDLTPPISGAPIYLLETINPADGSTRELFYFMPSRSFGELIQNFNHRMHNATIWSPDGRKLVFTLAYGESQARLRDFVIESESSGSLVPRVLGHGSLAIWSPK